MLPPLEILTGFSQNVVDVSSEYLNGYAAAKIQYIRHPPRIVFHSDSSPVVLKMLAMSWTTSDIGGLNSGSGRTQRLMMSAKRDNTFSEHSPRIEGSTIFVRESMS